MRVTARGALRAIFALQLGIAAGLLSRDFLLVAPSLALPSRAPGFDQPVQPGDQTRRFAPARRLTGPVVPGYDASDMPSRLFFEQLGPDVVRATGTIEEGDAERFVEWLDRRGAGDTPLPGRLQLHSPGGSVSDALAIGRRLRSVGISTEIAAGDVCLSACPYMLAGGVDRVVSEEARVGVHQHYYGETTILPAFLAVEDIQRGQALVLIHLTEMGVNPALMALAMATPPEEIYLLLPTELTDLGLATEIID